MTAGMDYLHSSECMCLTNSLHRSGMAAEHEGRKACPEITGQDKCVEPYGIATQLLVEYLVILVL